MYTTLFAIAKASAYSSILTFFPVLLIVGSGLANWRKGAPYLREISYALGSILPAGGNTALGYLKAAAKHPVGLLVTTSLITLWTASGVMISWMEGFRRCYELPKTWGLVKERLIAFLLVIFALVPMTFATLLVAVGSKFETRLLPYIDPDFSVYILLLWGGIRWVIATLTSISVIALIYHHAVPRTQPWHSVIPGAILATVLVFGHRGFRAYLQHFGDFGTIYGSLGVGHGAAGLDVHDLAGGAGGRGIQCATIPSRHAGERTHGDQQLQIVETLLATSRSKAYSWNAGRRET